MKNNFGGQILLITLVVLTILSIITISIVLLTSRDVSQVVSNQRYDLMYSSLEDDVQNLVETVGKYEANLSVLTSAPYNCVRFFSRWYICNNNEVVNDGNLTKSTVVSNEKNYENYELFKDRSLEINLGGYRERISFYWDRPGLPLQSQAALEFLLIYRDSSGVYRTKSDLYDPGNIFTSSPDSNLPFIYDQISGYESNLFVRRINFSAELLATDIPEKLIITPRMLNDNDSIQIDIVPLNAGAYPDQLRRFSGNAVINGGVATPIVNLITQIPIHPQGGNLLEYTLLTPGEVRVN